MALGDYLRREREARGMSLRDVENALKKIDSASKVSSGHLSVIEQGKVTPGPKTLHSLSAAMGLDYVRLMVEAGYLDADVLDKRPATPAPAFRGTDKLNETEKEQVQSIIDLLTQRKSSRQK